MLPDAYFAGFFDGEGAISILYQQPPGRRRTHRLRVTCTQVAPEALRAMQERFGGRLNLIQRGRTEPNKRPIYAWAAYASEAEGFLRAVLPYLIVKRPQAEIALRFRSLFGAEYRSVGRGRRASESLVAEREACRVEMLALNRRGIAVG